MSEGITITVHPARNTHSGHDCIEPGCTALAVYGMQNSAGIRWACLAHRHKIGFLKDPAPHSAEQDQPPARVPQSAAPVARDPSQGRLL